MKLFKNTYNNDIEGVTVLNACYGGVSALLNTFNWLFSKYYDNKYEILICEDNASYGKGPVHYIFGKDLLTNKVRENYKKD